MINDRIKNTLNNLIEFRNNSFNIKSIKLDFIETNISDLKGLNRQQSTVDRIENKEEYQNMDDQVDIINHYDKLDIQIK